MKQDFSRRFFLKGAAIGGLSLASMAGLSACSPNSTDKDAQGQNSSDAKTKSKASTESFTFADTVVWDGEFDVVIMGFGGAGATAARFAADKGANVLLCDKAPEGHEGGNTRYCGQLVASADDADKMFTYAKGLGADISWDEEYLKKYCAGMADMKNYFKEYLGVEAYGWKDKDNDIAKHIASMTPEYPELEGAETFDFLTVHEGISDSQLWGILRQNVLDRSDKIAIWYESPVTKLIQDPFNKTILGAVVKHEGKELNIRAINGVIIAAGGFENNIEMHQNYFLAPRLAPIGTLYNTGDAFPIVLEVGAKLWHMANYEGITNYGGYYHYVEDNERAQMLSGSVYQKGSIFVVADDGSRFVREDEPTRHGHVYTHGLYRNPIVISHPYMIFDETKRKEFEAMGDKLKNNGFLNKLVSASSMAELAEKCGLNPEILQKTFDNFNEYAKSGDDKELNRKAENMSVFDSGPYYAARLVKGVLNTQGGAQRNLNAEIINADGEPIPHLYSCGEFGCLVPNQYQGGFNIAECLIFGKVAGENAAEKKEELEKVVALAPVESKKECTIASAAKAESKETGASKPSAKPELKENQYYGEAKGMGGTVGVIVTKDGDKITNVEVVSHSETQDIGTKAIDQLSQMIVDKNSTEVDDVSGATVTSKAIKEAVAAALSSK